MITSHILWEKTEYNTARLLRFYGTSGHVIIPESIEGYPIVEIAPYCFSATKRVNYEKISEEIVMQAGLQEICGDIIEEIILPDTIKKIDNYAFYNCKKLRKIEIGTELEEVSGTAFMNSISLHQIVLRGQPTDKSNLRTILSRFSSDIEVMFEAEGEIQAKLLFPEYYESIDEVAPAHLFGRNIEGEGFRARQCIRDGVMEFNSYDEIFEQACVDEKEHTLIEMAYNRIRYPYNLAEEHRKRYSKYLTEHNIALCRKLVKERLLCEFEILLKQKIFNGVTLNYAIEIATEAEWAEGVAMLLHLKSSLDAVKERYEFDAF